MDSTNIWFALGWVNFLCLIGLGCWVRFLFSNIAKLKQDLTSSDYTIRMQGYDIKWLRDGQSMAARCRIPESPAPPPARIIKEGSQPPKPPKSKRRNGSSTMLEREREQIIIDTSQPERRL